MILFLRCLTPHWRCSSGSVFCLQFLYWSIRIFSLIIFFHPNIQELRENKCFYIFDTLVSGCGCISFLIHCLGPLREYWQQQEILHLWWSSMGFLYGCLLSCRSIYLWLLLMDHQFFHGWLPVFMDSWTCSFSWCDIEQIVGWILVYYHRHPNIRLRNAGTNRKMHGSSSLLISLFI